MRAFERLAGRKFNRILTPGINVLVPIIDRPRAVAWSMPRAIR